MKLLIHLRNEARKNKNFALADAIRKGLTEIGVTLEDRPDGTIWRKRMIHHGGTETRRGRQLDTQ